MSIKQLGGVFGRNPTFNDVTIEGQLTFDGDIDINSDLKVDGDLDVTGTSTLTGNVGLGTSPLAWHPDYKGLNVGSGGSLYGRLASNETGLGANFYRDAGAVFKRINAGFATNIIQHGGNHYWNTAPTGAADSTATFVQTMLLDPSGNLTINTGNLVIGTSGKGIDFSATAGPNPPASGTSELLDDYEEGVWTPTVGGDATYHVQDGYYVKVGTLVYVQGKIQVNVLGTGSATTVSGLPFTALNAALSSAGTGSSSYFGTIATNVTTLVPYVNNATATVIFGSLGAAGGIMTGVTTVFQNSARVDFSLSYRSV